MGEKVPAPFYNRALAARRLICVQLHQIRPGGASAVGIACGRGTAPASSDGLVPGTEKKEEKKPRTTKKVPSTKSCRFLTRYGSLDGSGVRVCGAARCQAAVRSPAAEAAALLKRWLGLQISIVRSRWGSTSFNCVHSVLRARIHPTACYAAHPVC